MCIKNLCRVSFGLALSVFLTGAATAASYFEEARVVRVEPIVERIWQEEPFEECWDESYPRRYRHHASNEAAATLMGGIIGGVVGNQFGKGGGKIAATIAGGLLGASVGNSWSGDDEEYHYTAYKTRTHCHTQYSRVASERPVGYRVTYRLRGREFVTEMDEYPGRTIPVKVQVMPYGY